MRGVAVGEAPLDAGMTVVRGPGAIRHHANHLRAAHLRLEPAADAAVGAGCVDRACGLASSDEGFLLQRAGGAGLDARAAGYALGFHERFVLARRHARSQPPALDRKCKSALRLVAGAHATRADDAQRGIENEIRVAGVASRGAVGPGAVTRAIRRRQPRGRLAVTRTGDAQRSRGVLQFAMPVRRTVLAVERVLGDIQLHDIAPQPLQRVALRPYLHARRDLGRAGGGEALPPFDLDEAQPAGAKGFQVIGGAKFRDPGAGERRRAHDRGARGHADRNAVDFEREVLVSAYGRRAQILVVDGVHGSNFLGLPVKILTEVRQCAAHRVRRHAPQPAQ